MLFLHLLVRTIGNHVPAKGKANRICVFGVEPLTGNAFLISEKRQMCLPGNQRWMDDGRTDRQTDKW